MGVYVPWYGGEIGEIYPKKYTRRVFFTRRRQNFFVKLFQAIRFIDANCLKKFGEKILTSSWVKNSPRPENPEKWSFWSLWPFLRVIMTGIEFFRKCHRIALVTPYPVTSLKKAIFTVCSREKGRRVKYLVEPKQTVNHFFKIIILKCSYTMGWSYLRMLTKDFSTFYSATSYIDKNLMNLG